MSFSVIIPSKSAANLVPCVEAVRKHEPEARIIVVDDGLSSVVVPMWVKFVVGEKPFIFARNVNLGIQAAGSDDVVILNDDALLETPGGFSRLVSDAADNIEYGLISATTNVAGNRSQYPMGIGLRDEPRTVAFVCVLIPRRTIETVGPLDERFGGTTPDGRRIYGFCDNDYCRRIRELTIVSDGVVRNAGLKIGIHDGCFVDHGSLRSEFRGDPHAPGDISAAGELYTQKWGDWL
jgi:glycosyltransferase involved in cell wall biosynthesis